MKRRSLHAGLVALVLAIGLGWFKASSHAGAENGTWQHPVAAPRAHRVLAEGQLEPYRVVQIKAPFDGTIVRVAAEVGALVRPGDELVEVDPSSALIELREMQIARVRAMQALEELRHWQRSSSEVLGAQRQAARAQSLLQAALKRVAETAALHEKGVVARMELEAAKGDLANAQSEKESADEALAAALAKGSTVQVRLAELALRNADAKLEGVQRRLALAVVKAPMAGIVLAPGSMEGEGSHAAKLLVPGAAVSARETVATLGDVSMLKVVAYLDEGDVAKVSTGMPVEVRLGTDDGVALPGVLQHISSQARRDGQQGTGTPSFEIHVLVRNAPPVAGAGLRVGVSARLVIPLASEPDVLSVPLAAVLGEAGKPVVVVRRAGAQHAERQAVELGEASLDRVSVRKGLSLGDWVWVPADPSAQRHE